MGTSFQDIYCQSRLLKIDKKLSLLPKPMYYSLNFRWLRYAISMFEYDIKPQAKLQEYTPFWEQDYYFVGDGNETEFLADYPTMYRPIQSGDNLRGKTIYFNTAILKENWQNQPITNSIYYDTYLNIQVQGTDISYNINASTYKNEGDICLYNEQTDEVIEVLYDGKQNKWLKSSYTFDNDYDYIVSFGSYKYADATVDKNMIPTYYSMLISYTPFTFDRYIGTRENSNNATYNMINTSDYTMFLNFDGIHFTFNNAPSNLSDIFISLYNEGNFAYDLTEREITILAEAMVIPFVEQYKNNATLDKALIYGGSMKSHSPANLLDKHIASAEDQRNYVQSLISEYTYKTEYYTQDSFKPLGTFWARRNGR